MVNNYIIFLQSYAIMLDNYTVFKLSKMKGAKLRPRIRIHPTHAIMAVRKSKNLAQVSINECVCVSTCARRVIFALYVFTLSRMVFKI